MRQARQVPKAASPVTRRASPKAAVSLNARVAQVDNRSEQDKLLDYAADLAKKGQYLNVSGYARGAAGKAAALPKEARKVVIIPALNIGASDRESFVAIMQYLGYGSQYNAEFDAMKRELDAIAAENKVKATSPSVPKPKDPLGNFFKAFNKAKANNARADRAKNHYINVTDMDANGKGFRSIMTDNKDFNRAGPTFNGEELAVVPIKSQTHAAYVNAMNLLQRHQDMHGIKADFMGLAADYLEDFGVARAKQQRSPAGTRKAPVQRALKGRAVGADHFAQFYERTSTGMTKKIVNGQFVPAKAGPQYVNISALKADGTGSKGKAKPTADYVQVNGTYFVTKNYESVPLALDLLEASGLYPEYNYDAILAEYERTYGVNHVPRDGQLGVQRGREASPLAVLKRRAGSPARARLSRATSPRPVSRSPSQSPRGSRSSSGSRGSAGRAQ